MQHVRSSVTKLRIRQVALLQKRTNARHIELMKEASSKTMSENLVVVNGWPLGADVSAYLVTILGIQRNFFVAQN